MKKYFSVIVTILAFSTGCTHYYYVPNIQNIPMFREKNEARLSGSYGGGDESNGFELQGSWAVTNHFGLSSSFLASKSPQSYANEEWGKGSYIDAGAGFFSPINKYGVFEVYGGLGAARQTHNYTSADDYSGGTIYWRESGMAYLKSRRLFVQPAIGFEFNVFEIAFSTRLSRLWFNDVDFNINSDDNEYDFNTLTRLSDKRVYYFVEPALTLRAGWKNIKLQAQYSVGSYAYSDLIPFEAFHLALGVNISFGERFKKDRVPAETK